MKKLFLTLALGLFALGSSAQISTGESTSKVIRTGNRAKAGNFGLYFGATTDMFNKIGDDNVDFSALPLINLKYMYTDQLEFRVGIEWWKKTENAEWQSGTEDEPKTSERTNKETRFMLYPGVAYHFSRNNLLDVYAGGELPIGYSSYGWDNGDDDLKASSFRIGLGAFIGLQAYVANLPLAVGVEYGLSTMYKSASNASYGGNGGTIDYDAFEKFGNEPVEDLNGHKFELGHQVRFTLSYYFNL